MRYSSEMRKSAIFIGITVAVAATATTIAVTGITGCDPYTSPFGGPNSSGPGKGCEEWKDNGGYSYGITCKSGYWYQCGVYDDGNTQCWDSEGRTWCE